MPPFHFAFFVRDLASTRRFYRDVLGCREGRSTDTWADFDFFGSQISAHVTGPVTATTDAGVVDGVHVPMPHFGALLEWDQFQQVADRIRQAEIAFIIEPRVRYPGHDCSSRGRPRSNPFSATPSDPSSRKPGD